MEQQSSVWQRLIDIIAAKIEQADNPDTAAKWVELLHRVADRREREIERAQQTTLSSDATSNGR